MFEDNFAHVSGQLLVCINDTLQLQPNLHARVLYLLYLLNKVQVLFQSIVSIVLVNLVLSQH